ncbi:triose-phosphate isomerase [Ancylobacter sp. 6x-1]|uniref:Triosephosphate isomerase n=1 Tax=Ancylobacter crimeensis TaxID=2579147 RepID=A0ABT0DCG4_9HYPH|nr:triose-phosphate isomerase [Ancylobacter crimeensis]MCK0197647.1 triose-phosphate isomerase [Ancylobacter crimeensis]
MSTRRPLIAGNWKMNGLAASAAEVERMIGGAGPIASAGVDLLICPPATLIARLAALTTGSPIAIGGQDCDPRPNGAHTGDIAAEMLVDAGAAAVILGHSERRADHGETDAVVRAKAEGAHRAGLLRIVCVGETQAERDAGQAVSVVARQLAESVPDTATGADLVIAYEPVWAIGTGLTPTPEDIVEIHAAMRGLLRTRFGAEAEGMRLLYGGSVKPDNAAVILNLPDVDGALVGGASLKATDFLAIAGACAGR